MIASPSEKKKRSKVRGFYGTVDYSSLVLTNRDIIRCDSERSYDEITALIIQTTATGSDPQAFLDVLMKRGQYFHS
jgi:hypothetical protein